MWGLFTDNAIGFDTTSVGLLHGLFGANDEIEKTAQKSRHPQVFLHNNFSPPPEELVDVYHSSQQLQANHQV
jgi:hypothetical protein